MIDSPNPPATDSLKALHDRAYKVIKRITFRDRTIRLVVLHDLLWLQLQYIEPDTATGEMSVQNTRPWPIFEKMTDSEIIKTVWLAIQVSTEHQNREHFLVDGHAIFGPHQDVQAQVEIAERTSFGGYAEALAEDGLSVQRGLKV